MLFRSKNRRYSTIKSVDKGIIVFTVLIDMSDGEMVAGYDCIYLLKILTQKVLGCELKLYHWIRHRVLRSLDACEPCVWTEP